MYPRPLTCINRNMCTGSCFKPPRQPAPAIRSFDQPPMKDYDFPRYCDSPSKINYLESLLPFVLRPKNRKPPIKTAMQTPMQTPRDKWIRCEFDGDEEVTTSEVPLSVNLGPGDYSDKNLQLTLNLKLVPRPPEKEPTTFCKYFRKKRRRFKDMLSCFPSSCMRRRREETSGLGLRDLMARMVGALDDIRTALRDMKKGQDDFVGNDYPSQAIESSSSVKEPRKDAGKMISEKCNLKDSNDSLPKRNWSNIVKKESASEIESTKSTQTFNEAHDRRANHHEDRRDKNSSENDENDADSRHHRDGNRKRGSGESNNFSNSASDSSFRQQNLNENRSEKSASSEYDYDENNYPNNPTVNFVLTNIDQHKRKDKSNSSIASKIETLAEATSRLQELVSIPVTRKTLNEASASIKDILNLTDEIYEDKSEVATNTGNTNIVQNPQGQNTMQGKLHSKSFRKSNASVVEDLSFPMNQNTVGCIAKPLKSTSTYTSVANLSLFPGQKETAPPKTNSVPRSRNKRRKTNKMNNNLPSTDRKGSARRSNFGAGPSSARNKLNNGSSTEATTSSDQVRKLKTKTLSLNRNRTRPISPIHQEPSSFSTTLTSSNKSSSTDEVGIKKNCAKGRSCREDQGLPGSSRSEDNDNRWPRRRKFTANRRDGSDKSYPRLSGAGSSGFRHSGMSDPADELLRAMLERATK